jgi:TRAP-type mannitol/chloroaromatic compound transport system permease large subunit
VLLILYGATASVSVVQLYAGAFFPGLMLAGLYIGYVIIRAWLNPSLAPMPSKEEQHVALPEWAERLPGGRSRLAIRRWSERSAGTTRGSPPEGSSARSAWGSFPPSWSSFRSCSSTTPPPRSR